MYNNKEANIISFKVLLTQEGNIVTEFSHLPVDKARKIFMEGDIAIIEKIINEGKRKLEPLHDFIQEEVKSVP